MESWINFFFKKKFNGIKRMKYHIYIYNGIILDVKQIEPLIDLTDYKEEKKRRE